MREEITMLKQELVKIERDSYIYRVVHRIMEGDCQMNHGPELVTVGPLLAQKYCVTNAMYYEFIRESGYQPKNPVNYLKHWENGKYRPGQEDLPVVNISQDDARAYAEHYGMRLPTEAEWQYLAAGPAHLKYPWGNNKEYARCNVYGEQLERVDSHPEGVSPFGLYNMCGNVWEFTADCMHDHAPGHEDDHRFIVLRGGSYYTAPDYWHAEGGATPNDYHLKVHQLGDAMNRYETVGFRCVKECD
ncbi:SUMF1/EgtB/PvdO family nonheme iron enzyme [Feifania hominis]|uniref:Formylglycine-generating enzyme family protein n=1 Tax=Feifania hominis TaxID=2763660 RepID=A0A926DE43_9FIRM|nr:formylglycine-generating enzyme family protein [Feifania hominis]